MKIQKMDIDGTFSKRNGSYGEIWFNFDFSRTWNNSSRLTDKFQWNKLSSRWRNIPVGWKLERVAEKFSTGSQYDVQWFPGIEEFLQSGWYSTREIFDKNNDSIQQRFNDTWDDLSVDFFKNFILNIVNYYFFFLILHKWVIHAHFFQWSLLVFTQLSVEIVKKKRRFRNLYNLFFIKNSNMLLPNFYLII